MPAVEAEPGAPLAPDAPAAEPAPAGPEVEPPVALREDPPDEVAPAEPVEVPMLTEGALTETVGVLIETDGPSGEVVVCEVVVSTETDGAFRVTVGTGTLGDLTGGGVVTVGSLTVTVCVSPGGGTLGTLTGTVGVSSGRASDHTGVASPPPRRSATTTVEQKTRPLRDLKT